MPPPYTGQAQRPGHVLKYSNKPIFQYKTISYANDNHTKHAKTEREQKGSNTVTVAAASKSWNAANNTKVDLVVIDAFLSDPASTNG